MVTIAGDSDPSIFVWHDAIGTLRYSVVAPCTNSRGEILYGEGGQPDFHLADFSKSGTWKDLQRSSWW